MSDEAHPPYDRPPLTKEFLRGEQARDDLVYDPADALEAQGIRLLLDTAAAALDPDGRTVRLADGTTVRYGAALLATGGRPVHLDLPGASLDGIHYLRTVDDAAALAAGADEGVRAAIVGGGFIGLEAAASLTQRGVEVTVLEAAPRVWARFAAEALSDFVADYCSQRGVAFRTGADVTGFEGDGRVRAVRTADGPVPCDLALVAVGIHPNVDLAREAGLDVDDGIVVDEHMATSVPDVYAAGDAANYPDPHFGRRRRVEHWGHAEHTGQVAGANMAGETKAYDLLTYVWSDIFDLHLEFAGDETVHERAVLRGDPAGGSFSVLYLADDRLTAYFAVNTAPKEFAALRRLITRRVNLAGKVSRLTDLKADLKQL